mmetsp:Transcript_12288/g.16861  ORF Transcript_12288/g.16861 Transcript_12288/m.16861 type:complete len:376 (+) Transcript_12288:3-1130(+)
MKIFIAFYVILHSFLLSKMEASIDVYLGSYSTEITRWRYSTSRTLQFVEAYFSGNGPSWLVANGAYLYAANENDARIQAFSMNSNLELVSLNGKETFGEYPCFISVAPNGKFILVANYGMGALNSFPVDSSTGNLLEPYTVFQSPANTSHMHCAEIFEGDTDTYVAVVDLGLDTVSQYKLNSQGIQSSLPTNTITFAPGMGPRHIKFHPFLPFAVVICELSNALITLSLDRSSGLLSQPPDLSSVTISTLRAQADATDMRAAEITFSPNGKFLYASNRDVATDPTRFRSSIAVFEVTGETNISLKMIQQVTSNGNYPRYFQLIKEGTELIVVNQIDNNFVSYLVDVDTGLIDEESAVITTHPYLYKPTHALFVGH